MVKSTPSNLAILLANLPEWRSALALDDFSDRIIWTSHPPDVSGFPSIRSAHFREEHVLLVQAWFSNRLGVQFNSEAILRASQAAAQANSFDPLRNYLDNLAWDGRERLPTWLPEYLGVEDNLYTRAVGCAWMISAVARAKSPGCKADHMLVLEGPQGLGKSRALRELAGPYFLDHLPDLRSKDARGALRGNWIIEVAELDGFTRAEVSTIKAFLSTQEDKFRPSYGRLERIYPRRCVFAGTTNGQTWLRDTTGNRRFWPVHVSHRIDLDQLQAVRGQLWAEANARYERGEPWYLVDDDLIQQAASEQESRVQMDPWEPKVEDEISYAKCVTAEGVLATLKRETGGQSKADLMRVTTILTRLGWTKRRETRVDARERSLASARIGATGKSLLDSASERRLVLWTPPAPRPEQDMHT
jgi:predicted P-loop ATPase